MQGLGNKCVREVSTALSTLHRAELLREHEQVMQVMVMDSLVTHPGRNNWAAALLKGMGALRQIIRTQRWPHKKNFGLLTSLATLCSHVPSLLLTHKKCCRHLLFPSTRLLAAQVRRHQDQNPFSVSKTLLCLHLGPGPASSVAHLPKAASTLCSGPLNPWVVLKVWGKDYRTDQTEITTLWRQIWKRL